MAKDEKSAFINDENAYEKKIVAVPTPEKEIGIDTKEYLFQNIMNAGTASKIDVGAIEAFSTISRSRNQIYQLLDTMAEDAKIAAVLETYAEDATEYNDQGKIVWVESSNPNVAAYVNYLLKTLCIDKNIYTWVYNLCKYGDLYLRLYRKSEYTDLLFDDINAKEGSKSLNEDIDYGKIIDTTTPDKLEEAVKIKAYAKSDKYVRYVEMVPNPAEVFELTRFGKTSGYIQTEISTTAYKQSELQTSGYFRYKFKRGDVNLYAATEFVHACLEDNSSRVPEEVDIFLDNDANEETGTKMSYKVRRGQSLLYNVYKLWRELMLLENSVLLNRITKSSIVRVIGVEVGDMPKEMVGPHLQGIKQMIEQKSAIDVGNGMGEYTNPGPIENNIYVPTHEGVGNITTTQIGGDVDVKGLADLDYYLNAFYGSLRVPKQYFSQTDDSTGFNGGTSLSVISSRYAKMIKRIQNTVCQAITDIINLMLLDSGLDNYVNNFTIRMQSPTTQEEKDRSENTASRVSLISDVMNLLNEVESPITKLKVLKTMLANAVTNTEVTTLLAEEIKKLEADREDQINEEAKVTEDTDELEHEDLSSLGGEEYNPDQPLDLSSGSESTEPVGFNPEVSTTSEPAIVSSETLPSPEELGLDLTAPEEI